MHKKVQQFIDFVQSNNGIADKARLTKAAIERFELIRERSVYYCDGFAVRFSSAKGNSFSNTVLSLSNLRKYDNLPFIVCVVTPDANRLMLANSTFLNKISHSSHQLSNYNIKGSFNGSDIMKEFLGKRNEPENFEFMFASHFEIGFEGNLTRLVEATNNISPTGHEFEITIANKKVLLDSVNRAAAFVRSADFLLLQQELDEKVSKYEHEILIASHIENVNIRGRLIEYLIAGENEDLKGRMVEEMAEEYGNVPSIRTDNTLGDYRKVFSSGTVSETDVKTKLMLLNSNPKAYNIDKFLEFMSQPASVFLFYFIGIGADRIVNKILVSVYQSDLVDGTLSLRHWAGRNSRGVTQLDGKVILRLIENPKSNIDREKALRFLEQLIGL
jgi:hypothetical protein